MVATSGAVLIDDEAVDVLVRELFPRATLVTPNLDEAAPAGWRQIETEADMEARRPELIAMGARAVLLKGGHLRGDDVSDLLLGAAAKRRAGCVRPHRDAEHAWHRLHAVERDRRASGSGRRLPEAVERARDYVREALAAGADVRTGAGNGPLNHGFAPIPVHRLA